ncbi:hypothetical protein C0J52_24146 [Blattella germanica]|nr:hypothetical protein C0J52_24146 [Blattella germanica]
MVLCNPDGETICSIVIPSSFSHNSSLWFSWKCFFMSFKVPFQGHLLRPGRITGHWNGPKEQSDWCSCISNSAKEFGQPAFLYLQGYSTCLVMVSRVIFLLLR